MAAFLAAGMGLMAVGGSMLQNRAENKNAEADARQLGVQEAGIQFGSERKAAFLLRAVESVEAAAIQERAAINAAHARAESDAKVSAAHAGVDGQSVDAVVNDTDRTAAQAKGSVENRAREASLQLTTDYVDNFLNAKMQTGNTEFRSKSGSAVFAQHALSFGQGFLSAGGFGE